MSGRMGVVCEEVGIHVAHWLDVMMICTAHAETIRTLHNSILASGSLSPFNFLIRICIPLQPLCFASRTRRRRPGCT